MELIKINEKFNGNYLEYVMVDDTEKYNFFVARVNPVIIYPECMRETLKQSDCFNCDKRNECTSPRSFCTRAYHNHPKGCPNYGNPGCPPDMPMLDWVYDISKPIYFIGNEFNLKEHVAEMRKKHPNWTDYQLRNVLYWQSKSISINNKVSNAWVRNYPNLVLTNYIESMGVNFNESLREVGMELTFGPNLDFPKRITLAGEVLNSISQYDLYVETSKDNVKRLQKKK